MLRIVAAEDDGEGSPPLLDYVIRTDTPVKDLNTMALGTLASAASYVVTAAAKANAKAAQQSKQYRLYLTTEQNDLTSKIAKVVRQALVAAGVSDMRISRVMLLGAALSIPGMVHAQSPPGWQQTLQDLATGNQSQASLPSRSANAAIVIRAT